MAHEEESWQTFPVSVSSSFRTSEGTITVIHHKSPIKIIFLIFIDLIVGKKEKKEPTDDTSKDVYSLLAQHVSGIIMPIVRRQTE